MTQQSLSEGAVLAVLEQTDAPFITTRDIADALDVTPQAARRDGGPLQSLKEQDILTSKSVGNSNAWYRTEWDAEEQVIPFPDERRFVVINATDATLSGVSDWTREMYHWAGHYEFMIDNGVMRTTFQSEQQVRNQVSSVIDHPQFVEDIIDRWYRDNGEAIFWTAPDSTTPILGTRTKAIHDNIYEMLSDNAFLERMDDRHTKLNPEQIVDTVSRINDAYHIRDNRRPQEKRREIIRPFLNCEPEGVGHHQKYVGIDGEHHLHAWDGFEQEMIVLGEVDGDFEIIHSQPISNPTAYRDWIYSHVEDKRGWVELDPPTVEAAFPTQ